MECKFILGNHTKKDGSKLVELYYYNEGQKVRLSTKVHVIPKFFDETAVLKVSSKVSTSVADNRKLKEMETRMNNIISDWQQKIIAEYGQDYSDIYPPASYIKGAWKKPAIQIKKESEEDVRQIFHTWIEGDPKRGIIGKKDKVNEVKIYRTVLADIKKLTKKQPLTFRDIDQDFFERLLGYWTSKKPKIQNSTVNKRLTCLKIFLRQEKQNKYTFFESFSTGLSGIAESPIIIPTPEEFLKLINAEKELNVYGLPEELDRARDYFVIGCSTSLRYSDIARLQPENIRVVNNFDCIVSFIKKTQTPKHLIPLNDVSKFFIEKQFKANSNKGIKYMSNWKLNVTLHKLFKMLNFNSMETVVYKYGAKPTTVLTPKWEAMSMHASRAFFISTCVNSNQVSLGSTMSWSNHRNIKVVQRYIHQGFNQVQQMQDLFSGVNLPNTTSLLQAMRKAKLEEIDKKNPPEEEQK